MLELEEKLTAFVDAYETILRISEEHVNKMVQKQKSNLISARQLFLSALKEGKRVHIAGMGRSKLAAIIIGDLLKNLGFQVSVIGDFLSKPVRSGDLVLAVSASGWTTTTCMMVEEAIRLGAKILALTATPRSKLDRLADVSIYLPGGSIVDETSYIVRQIMGRHKTPLTPMGTIPETNAILTGIGLVGMLIEESSDPVGVFGDYVNLVLKNARDSLSELLQDLERLSRFVNIISSCKRNGGSKIYLIGAGINKFVSLMSAMRFQHLGLNVFSIDDWKFRDANDVLIGISSSGESAITLLYAKEAKRTGMNLISLTASPGSTLSNLSDVELDLLDISKREEYLEFRVFKGKKPRFIPAFEYAALLVLESVVAQIAEEFSIREEDMRRLHANIE